MILGLITRISFLHKFYINKNLGTTTIIWVCFLVYFVKFRLFPLSWTTWAFFFSSLPGPVRILFQVDGNRFEISRGRLQTGYFHIGSFRICLVLLWHSFISFFITRKLISLDWKNEKFHAVIDRRIKSIIKNLTGRSQTSVFPAIIISYGRFIKAHRFTYFKRQ